MEGELRHCGNKVHVTLNNKKLTWKQLQNNRQSESETENSIDLEDLICAEIRKSNENQVHITYIKRQQTFLLRRKSVLFDGSSDVCRQWAETIQQALAGVPGRPKKLLVFVCPVSGYKKSMKVLESLIKPIFTAAGIEYDIIVTEAVKHAYKVMLERDLTQYDGVVSAGGDGLLQEVVSGAFEQTQKQHNIDIQDPDCIPKPLDIPISPIPVGTGNGIAFVCFGTKDVETSILAIVKGKTKRGNLLGVYADNRHLTFAIMFTVYGFLVEMVYNLEKRRLAGPVSATCRFFYDLLTGFRKGRQDWQLEVRYLKSAESDRSQLVPVDERKYEWTSQHGLFGTVMFMNFDISGGMKTRSLRGLDQKDGSLVLLRPLNIYRFFRFVWALMSSDLSGLHYKAVVHENIRALEVKLKSSAIPGMKAESILEVDGELYKLEKKEFSVRFYGGAVNMFDGFPSEEEEKLGYRPSLRSRLVSCFTWRNFISLAVIVSAIVIAVSYWK